MENTYWNSNGKYQAWYEELWKQVPTQGKAEKSHIDLVRCAAKLYHDHYNNGGCNWDILKGYVWSNLNYWNEELFNSPEGGDYPGLLSIIEKTMDSVDSMGDGDTWDDAEEVSQEINTKIKTLDKPWEKLIDIIVRYAWEKEHA